MSDAPQDDELDGGAVTGEDVNAGTDGGDFEAEGLAEAADADADADDDVDGDGDDDDDDDDDGDGYEAGDANTVRGAAVARVLEYLARQLVDEPDGVVIDATDRGRSITYNVTVAPDDMGKIIGKRGRVVQSIRTVVRAAGAREGIEVNVEVLDD